MAAGLAGGSATHRSWSLAGTLLPTFVPSAWRREPPPVDRGGAEQESIAQTRSASRRALDDVIQRLDAAEELRERTGSAAGISSPPGATTCVTPSTSLRATIEALQDSSADDLAAS